MSNTVDESAESEFANEEQTALATHFLEFADDEFVHGDRLLDWYVKTPTLESHITLANIIQDELGHAREWYERYADTVDMSVDDLVYERRHDEFVHGTLVELPFDQGSWDDAVVRMYLYDVAERHRLENLQGSTYNPIDDLIGKVLQEESFHREHASEWLKALTTDEGRERIEKTVNRLLPYALTLFESAANQQVLVDSGICTKSARRVRNDWFKEVRSFFDELDVDLQVESTHDLDGVSLPEYIGRGKRHTHHWIELHQEQTMEYRNLGLQETDSTL